MSKYGPEKESKSEDGMISQAKYVHTTNTVPEFPNIIRQAFTSLTGTYSDLVDMRSQQVQERNSCCLPAMMLPACNDAALGSSLPELVWVHHTCFFPPFLFFFF